VTIGGDDELSRDSWCPLGTRCPTTLKVLPCEEGSWCDIASTDGKTCDPAAICPEDSWTQNRILPFAIIAVIVAGFFILGASDPGVRSSDDGADSIQGVDSFTKVNFQCEQMSVTLPNGKMILHPINASFNSGELVAIMGP